MTHFNRRQLLQSSAGLAAVATVGACSDDPDLPLSDDAVIGPFGRDSSAEEVTAGLDLTGKTALVTGANSGLGYETMRVLALRGAHVIGAARTMEKAEMACNSVEGKTTPVMLELTDFANVAACVATVKSLSTPIDMLICNAGVMALPEQELINGIERHFVINHLGHFLLVKGLLDEVKAAPQGRVVTLSSGQATANAPDTGILFDNLAMDDVYTPNMGYGHSKLANALFSLELARQLDGTNATSNAVKPGVIMTNLGRNLPEWQIWASKILGPFFMKSVPQGAATTCYVATAPAIASMSGYMFEDCNPHRPGGFTEDVAMAKRLWDVSDELTKGYLT